MSIKRKHIFIVPAIVAVLAIYLAAATNPSKAIEDPISVLSICLVVFVLSGLTAVVSLIIIAIVQKEHWENRIYFFGQLLVPAVLIFYISYDTFRYRKYKQTKANIEDNRKFLTKNSDERNDSLFLRARNHLEIVFDNDNDQF